MPNFRDLNPFQQDMIAEYNQRLGYPREFTGHQTPTRPLSHTHDPSTSHAAERSIRDSGALETHNKAMAWLVARHPGLTASEYYAKSQDYPERFKGWDLQEIRRRLTTNMPAHVYQGEAKMGLRTKKEVTWWPK